jgi:hypothetical protein
MFSDELHNKAPLHSKAKGFPLTAFGMNEKSLSIKKLLERGG